MKKRQNIRSLRLSLLSIGVLAFFIFTAEETDMGGMGDQIKLTEKTEHLETGEYRTKTRMTWNEAKSVTGARDPQGRWDGPVTRVNLKSFTPLEIGEEDELDRDMDTVSVEKVPYKDGMRHGRSVTTFKDKPDLVVCYEMGKPITCQKSAFINTSDKSAFQYLSEGYPWYLVTANALDIEDAFLEAYMDTLESIIFAMEYLGGDFYFDYYDHATDSINQTVYDTITQINSMLTMYLGMEEMKNSEFRLAVIDHSRQDGSSTFDIVKTKYPDYLQFMSLAEINEQDFELFCGDFDSVMNTYGPLDVEDPFFVDSVDSHLFSSLSLILSSEEDTTGTLKSAPDVKVSKSPGSIFRKAQSILSPKEMNASPSEVGFMVFVTMLEYLFEGDIIAKALEQSFNDFQAIITTPTVTTDYMGSGSNTSADLNGYIHEDGGAAISSSGIAWATHYNPTIEDNNEVSGTGAGSFLITLDNLTEGVTYFARAYATNSEGTAYGNCVEFTVTSSSGIELAEFDHDFKIYPNPAHSMAKFSFKVESSERMSLTIINLKGQVTYQYDLGILPQGANLVELNLSELQSGIYNCQLAANGKVKALRKLVILQ